MSTSIQQHTPKAPERVDARATVAAPVDIYENRDEYLLLADLPGVTSDQLRLHFERGQLFLEASRNGTAPAGREYDYRRAFALPSGVDAGNIDASLTNGVLRVRLPKSEAVKPRRIEIKAQ